MGFYQYSIVSAVSQALVAYNREDERVSKVMTFDTW